MEAEEGTRKRKFREFLSNDFVELRSEEHNTTALSLDQKRRRFNEESEIIKDDNIEARYYHQRMRLDLELNLSSSLNDLNHHDIMNDYNKDYEEDKLKEKTIEKGLVLGQQITFNDDLDDDDDDDGNDHGDGAGGGGGGGGGSKDEMVARVCMKCHMFVLLCKATPVCPNCKFMHSPKDTSLSLSFTSKPTLIA